MVTCIGAPVPAVGQATKNYNEKPPVTYRDETSQVLVEWRDEISV
jgi:hypothetical protein